jgi:hypothetical protein
MSVAASVMDLLVPSRVSILDEHARSEHRMLALAARAGERDLRAVTDARRAARARDPGYNRPVPRRLGLPTLPSRLPIDGGSPPTLARARERLGGRAGSFADAGTIVRVDDAGGKPMLGVLLCCDERTSDVWLEAGFVKRTRRGAAVPTKVAAASPLARIAADALVFGRLEEGQRVRFEPPGRDPALGVLFEKCRYGALVADDAGAVFAVGFRRVWPLAEPHGGATS